jgi:uncharacterized protein YfaS (alpha-2-macroglobulin family)
LNAYRIAYYEVDDRGGSAPGSGAASSGAASSGAASSGAENSGAENSEPFTIVDYGPQGELPQEVRNPSIYMVFSQPVVPLAKLGEPERWEEGEASPELFTVDPPLPGVFRWYGTRLLAFESDAPSLPQRTYTVRASERLRSLGGKSLEGETSFTFETERLSALSFRLGDGESYVREWDAPPEDAKNMVFIFSYPVNLDEIRKWIRIQPRDGDWDAGGDSRVTLPFRASRPGKPDKRYEADQQVLLSLDKAPPPDTEVYVTLMEGARSEEGWLGTKSGKVFTFHTLLPFRPLRVRARSESSPHTEQSDSIPIFVEFSHDIDPESAARAFSLKDLPAFSLENIRVYGSTVVLRGLPLEYRRTYTLTVKAGLRDLFGRALGEERTFQVETGEASSYVYIGNQGSRMLEAGFPPRITWEVQNPHEIRKGIRGAAGPYERAADSGLEAMDLASLPRDSKRYFMEDLSPFLGPSGKGSVAMLWAYTVKGYNIYNRQVDRSAWLTVQVTDIGLTVRYAYNKVLAWATRLSTGEPVAGALVSLLAEDDLVREGLTDSQGLAVFDFPSGVFTALFTDPSGLVTGPGVNSRSDSLPFKRLKIRVVESGGAKSGGDEVEFRPNDSHNLWRSRIESAISPFEAEKPRPVIFLFTDRGVYRPGETVTFRGIDRELRMGQYHAFDGPYMITVKSGASRAQPVAGLTGIATKNGGSHGSFTLPKNLDPGVYTIVYTRRNAEESITFTVANFERLRMEASLDFPDEALIQGEQLAATLSASYLAGGPLAGAPFSWYWTRESAAFNPGGSWRFWKFGPEHSDTRNFIAQGEGNLGPDGTAAVIQEPRTDGVEGTPYRYRLESSVQDAARQSISVSGAVMVHPAGFYIAARLDSGKPPSGGMSASTPSAYLLSTGSQATLSWALVSPGGLPLEKSQASSEAAASAPLSIQLVRYEWKQARQAGIGGRVNLLWERVEEIVKEQTVNLNSLPGTKTAQGTLAFTPEQGGQWEVRMRTQDSRGRVALTRFGFYVSGSGWVRWETGDVDRITLTPDQSVYAPGDTAKLLVRSPLPKGKYLLTLEREGIISEKIIDLDGSARTIDIPIEESFVPVIYAALSSFTVRGGPPENTYYLPDLDKPKGIFGVTALLVDNASRHYAVEIEPAKGVYAPGEEAQTRIRVTLNGKPAANTELSFMAVDRGVVDLINYHVPDPLAFFYDPRHFPLGVRGADSRSLLIDPVTYSLSDLQGGDNGDASKLEERKDFRPTAVFEPYLLTGPDGTVTVKFPLPDSLTTYRCTAVAVGLTEFGIAEEDLRVSAPLTAVAALPRKLRWRDTGTVSLILTNLEREAIEAEVSLAIESMGGGSLQPASGLPVDTPLKGTAETAMEPLKPGDLRSQVSGSTVSGPRGSAPATPPPAVLDQGSETAKQAAGLHGPPINILEVDGESKKKARILPGAAVEVSFKVAAVGAGETQLVFTLRSPKVNERIIKPLNVDRPILYETVTATGTVPPGAAVEEGIMLPSQVPEGTGSLSLSLSASRLALLREAVGYLLDYPYGCLEQRTAALLPLVSFGDHLEAFGLESRVKNPRQAIEEELERIGKNKLYDGTYPYWPGGKTGNALVTLRVAHIAVLARAKGYKVPESIGEHTAANFETSDAANILSRDSFLYGYSIWVRAMEGDPLGGSLPALLSRGPELGISGFAFAGLAALEQGDKKAALAARDQIKRYIRPGARTLDLTDRYERRDKFWASETDRCALALMLYHALSPDDDMTGRLAATLIERQRRGIWSNTNSSFWAVLAFGRIADAEAGAEGVNKSPAGASVSLSTATLLDAEGITYSPVSRTFPFIDPPLAGLEKDALLPLRMDRLNMERSGRGPLYYTASLRYGIPAELAAPRDEGISVFAETLDADGKPVKDGRLIPGKTYTRRVIVSSSRFRTALVLRVPVPSGAELIDAALTTSSTPHPPPPEGKEFEDDDWPLWYAGPERFIMDDEARFHWDYFPEGRQELTFRFRAVMPGIYPTPPAQAECMYEEEVFGRSGGELIRIGE